MSIVGPGQLQATDSANVEAAVLLARGEDSDGNVGACAFTTWKDIRIYGYFTQAAFVNVAAEAHTYISTEFNNQEPTGWCYHAASADQGIVSSEYATIANSISACSTNRFVRCGFRKKTGPNQDEQGIIHLKNVSSWTFDTCYPSTPVDTEPVFVIPGGKDMQSMEFLNIMVDNGGDLFQFDVHSGETANVPGMTVCAGRHAYNGDMMVNVGAGDLVLKGSDIWSSNGGYYPNSHTMSGNIDIDKIQFCEIGIKRIFGDLIAYNLQKSIIKGPKSKVSVSNIDGNNTFIDTENGNIEVGKITATTAQSTKQAWNDVTGNRTLGNWRDVQSADTDLRVTLEADNSEANTWVLEVRSDNLASTKLDIVDETLDAGDRRTLCGEVPSTGDNYQYRASVVNGSATVDTWAEAF